MPYLQRVAPRDVAWRRWLFLSLMLLSGIPALAHRSPVRQWTEAPVDAVFQHLTMAQGLSHSTSSVPCRTRVDGFGSGPRMA